MKLKRRPGMIMDFTGGLGDETGLYYYGARSYDPKISVFLGVDQKSDKYPSWSPYTYTLDNPIRFIDPDGKEIKPYLIFDGSTNAIKIFDDNETPSDFSDDKFLGEFPAYNNVSSTSKGKWEDGKYEMLDKNSRFTHDGKVEKDGKTPQDSPKCRYGKGGIYRAKDFKESKTGKFKSGMAIHAGREDKDLEKRLTNGCIRTTPEAMEKIDESIKQYGPLQDIIIKNNKESDNTNKVKDINPPEPNL